MGNCRNCEQGKIHNTNKVIVETEGYPFHCDVYGAVLVVVCGQILFYRQENKQIKKGYFSFPQDWVRKH